MFPSKEVNDRENDSDRESEFFDLGLLSLGSSISSATSSDITACGLPSANLLKKKHDKGYQKKVKYKKKVLLYIKKNVDSYDSGT